MDAKTYIESGILELYVAGALSEKENQEVYEMMKQHPEVLQEILEIESAVIKLTESVAPTQNITHFNTIKSKLNLEGGTESKIIDISKPRYNWVTYTGWAASIVLAGGLLWTLNLNDVLKSDIKIAETQQELLEIQIEKSKINLNEANNLISVLRDNNISQIPLAGQGNFEQTYAKVYWDKAKQRIFLDAQGLPEPPEGKVYQVWSLTLAPLTPTSLGTIENFTSDENKIFEIENANQSQAFGITLEPAGGSKTPTMEQLYTLGIVKS
ncbi:anti-sigma factor [Tamlana sp. 62-3]|uniref:Anti-sigma factor n=1 Tax=Neotamlana sargassicola TaxID=2883125 RepID=A0A9X1I8P7_9FLAO|nr:anti-sigma factor [Tamlana sargassicola]MCB4808859.1 anti-sigma factor [Tamlana sargassicola]